MAYIETKSCPVCQEVRRFTNGVCNECRHRRKREELHKWNSMSYDARLDDLRKRVEKLEQGPPTY